MRKVTEADVQAVREGRWPDYDPATHRCWKCGCDYDDPEVNPYCESCRFFVADPEEFLDGISGMHSHGNAPPPISNRMTGEPLTISDGQPFEFLGTVTYPRDASAARSSDREQ